MDKMFYLIVNRLKIGRYELHIMYSDQMSCNPVTVHLKDIQDQIWFKGLSGSVAELDRLYHYLEKCLNGHKPIPIEKFFDSGDISVIYLGPGMIPSIMLSMSLCDKSFNTEMTHLSKRQCSVLRQQLRKFFTNENIFTQPSKNKPSTEDWETNVKKRLDDNLRSLFS